MRFGAVIFGTLPVVRDDGHVVGVALAYETSDGIFARYLGYDVVTGPPVRYDDREAAMLAALTHAGFGALRSDEDEE